MQKKRRSRDEQGGPHSPRYRLCLRLKANAWNSAFPSRESGETNKSTQRTRSEEKKSNGHTFLFIGLCMQQASKARAEQKSLVEGLGRLFLSSLRSTAAHLPDWGGICVLNRVAAEVSGRVCSHFLTELILTTEIIPAGLTTLIKTKKSPCGKHEVSELVLKPETSAVTPCLRLHQSDCPREIFERPTRSDFLSNHNTPM